MAARPVPERRSEPFALPTAHAQPQPRPFGRESLGSHPAPGLTVTRQRSPIFLGQADVTPCFVLDTQAVSLVRSVSNRTAAVFAAVSQSATFLGPSLAGEEQLKAVTTGILAERRFEHQSCDPLLPHGFRHEGFARQSYCNLM